MSSSSSDSDSSSDDVPLNMLAGGKTLRRDEEESDIESEEAEFGNDDDSDFSGGENEADSDADGGADESDSDGNVPLSALKSPQKKVTKPAKKPKAKPAKKTKTAKKTSSKKNTSKKTETTSSKKSNSGSAPLLASMELYEKSDKGQLIQALLCRWWYAITWPDPALLPATPPGYDAMDGFPGVYVCTSGDDVGKIKDFRDMSKCPNFNNFAKKPSSELVELLLKAIGNQTAALVKLEGQGTETEKDLRALAKWAKKLNCKKIDKEAEKVLKAKKLTLR